MQGLIAVSTECMIHRSIGVLLLMQSSKATFEPATLSLGDRHSCTDEANGGLIGVVAGCMVLEKKSLVVVGWKDKLQKVCKAAYAR